MSILLSLLTILSPLIGHGELNHFSVQPADIKKAACSQLTPPTSQKMSDFIDSQIQDLDLTIDGKFRGLEFKDEHPHLVELFKNMHNNYEKSSSFQLPKSNCNKVLCVMKQYYGSESPIKMLYIQAKFGLPTSPFASPEPRNHRIWKAEELDDLIIALETLPPSFLPIKFTYLLHFRTGYTLSIYKKGEGEVIANAAIDVFDVWDEFSKFEKIAVIIHELGHVIGRKYDLTSEWKRLPHEMVSRYAQTNEREDFAESFTAYRMAPKHLKKISLARYEFLKKQVFNGLEFQSTLECEAPFKQHDKAIQNIIQPRREMQNWTKNNKSQISAEIKRQKIVGSFDKIVFQQCASTYIKYNYDKTGQCIEDVIKKRAAIVELRAQNKEDINEKHFSVKNWDEQKIDPVKVHSLRQSIRRQIIEDFDRDFDRGLEHLSSATCKAGVESFVKYFPLKSQLIRSTPESSIAILNQACEMKDKLPFWEPWIRSRFDRIIK